MGTVYLFCLVFGFAFTVLGALLGQLVGGGEAGHGHAVDAGHDADFGGHDLGDFDGDGQAPPVPMGGGARGHHSGPMHLPLLSPAVISFFVASFGGTGLLFSDLLGEGRAWLHLPLALASAAGLGLLAAWTLYKVTTSFEKNRVARVTDALAAVAEVNVTVPRTGMGAIAYLSAGTRQVLPARSGDGRAHPQGSCVRVLRVLDGVAFVGEAVAPLSVGEPVEPLEAGGGPDLLRRGSR